MPAGKEKTDQLSMPIGLSTENDGNYFLLGLSCSDVLHLKAFFY